MIMADVLKIFLLVAAGLLMAIAYQLAAVALLPRTVARWNERLITSPLSSLTLGTILAAPFVLLSIRSFGAGAPVPGLLVLGPPTCAGLFGLSGLSLQIGRGLPTGDAEAAWRQVLRGAGVLVLLMLMPFFGWFVLIPGALALGLGLVTADAGQRLLRWRAAPPSAPTRRPTPPAPPRPGDLGAAP